MSLNGEGASRAEQPEAVEVPEEDRRTSSRQRTQTEKGREMQEKDARKREKAFNKAYDAWKKIARENRIKLKTFCTDEDLDKVNQDIQRTRDLVVIEYRPILRDQTPTAEILKRMEACVTLTNEINDLVCKRKETIKEEFNDQLEKDRVRIRLNKDEYGSVFGKTNTETISEKSDHSNDSNKNDAAAELAAKVEEAKAMEDIQVQQEHLHALETEEARMLAAMKQKKVEFRIKLEKERTKLQQIKTETAVKVAAARVEAYNSSGSDYEEENNPETNTAHRKTEPDIKLNPNATSFQPQASRGSSANQEAVSLAEAIASSLSMNRLPAPEPTTFSGDPMQFVDWKMTFMALIDRKPLPPSEKMFYLKMYL